MVEGFGFRVLGFGLRATVYGIFKCKISVPLRRIGGVFRDYTLESRASKWTMTWKLGIHEEIRGSRFGFWRAHGPGCWACGFRLAAFGFRACSFLDLGSWAWVQGFWGRVLGSGFGFRIVGSVPSLRIRWG